MNSSEYSYNVERQKFDVLKDRYISNGEVTWDTFSDDQSTHQKKVVLLTNESFKDGTLRIKYPCLLKIMENVKFNPNRPTTWLDESDNITSDFSLAKKIDPDRDLDWFPTSSKSLNNQYFESDVKFAYGLGFFAAIAIECRDVIVDLNNYTLEQHPEHALQQRFFAVIELADQPFIPVQGPSNFGTILRSANGVFIYNGRIGLSSHHGIHGNGVNNLMIENVIFDNFEVAALSLNGSKNVYCKQVNVVKNRQDIPVLGTYSASRFAKLFIDAADTQKNSSTGSVTAYNALNEALDEAFNAIILNNGTVNTLFGNPSGLLDGTGYGILFNSKGVAVNHFFENRSLPNANDTQNIIMINCNINEIKNKVNEILALSDSGQTKAQVGLAGEIFQFFNGVANEVNGKYYYEGNALSELQIEIAKIRTAIIEGAPFVGKPFFGTLNIDKGIQLWRDNSSYYFKKFDNDKIKLFDGNNDEVLINSQQVIYKVYLNGDTMFHVNKGILGLRVDAANNMNIIDCSITNIVAEGENGCSEFGNYLKSHPAQGNKLFGYHGDKAYGARFSAVNDLTIKNLQITNIESVNSTASGLVINNDSQNVLADNVFIRGITSSKDKTFDKNQSNYPNEVPISRGLDIGDDCTNISLRALNVKNIVNQKGSIYRKDYDIKSIVNHS